jgi:hypothetical protein
LCAVAARSKKFIEPVVPTQTRQAQAAHKAIQGGKKLEKTGRGQLLCMMVQVLIKKGLRPVGVA